MKAFLRLRLAQLKGRYPYLLFALSVLLLIIVFACVYYGRHVESLTEGNLAESLSFYAQQLAGKLADPQSPQDIMTAGKYRFFLDTETAEWMYWEPIYLLSGKAYSSACYKLLVIVMPLLTPVVAVFFAYAFFGEDIASGYCREYFHSRLSRRQVFRASFFSSFGLFVVPWLLVLLFLFLSASPMFGIKLLCVNLGSTSAYSALEGAAFAVISCLISAFLNFALVGFLAFSRVNGLPVVLPIVFFYMMFLLAILWQSVPRFAYGMPLIGASIPLASLLVSGLSGVYWGSWLNLLAASLLAFLVYRLLRKRYEKGTF